MVATLIARRAVVRAILGVSVLLSGTLVVVEMTNPVLATSGAGSPYEVPQAVDVNPDPHILETTIVADETLAPDPGIDIGNNEVARVMTFNGTVPGPELRLAVGDTLIVHYENHMSHASGIHWHGVEDSNSVDGTPLTQNMVAPGGKYLYKFVVPRPGVYWYHPHHHSSTNQVFKGLYGSLIVTQPAEDTLRTAQVLPSEANTHTMVLSDITVCHAGADDAVTYPSTSPHASGASPFPAQQAPHPDTLCDTPIDEEGAAIGTPLAEDDVPNIQRTSGASNEGRIVLTNGKNVGGRAGDQNAPGLLSGTAQTLNVAPGSGQRFRVINAAAIRYFRLRLTDSTGAKINLYRIGGEGGLLNEATLDGGVHGAFDFHFDTGEILLGPGERADVVAAIPTTATGVATLWELDFLRVGVGSGSGGWANLPTVPVAHLNVTGPAASPTFTMAAGTDLLTDPSVGESVEILPAATGGFITPAGGFVAPKLGTADQNIALGANADGSTTTINGVQGLHDFGPVDYTDAQTIGSTRYAAGVGDVLELRVTNTTGAHHPFHPHGFSVQPLSYEPEGGGAPIYTFGPEFADEIDVPAHTTLRYRVRLDDRPLLDGVTMGGATGRWVMHCHIFFHAVFGMISEFIVTDGTGNERPYINSDFVITSPQVNTGDPVSMTGTFSDPENDAVTLTASNGAVVDNGDGTWTWNGTAGSDRFIYITATDAGGKKSQAMFEIDSNHPPVLTATSASVTVNEGQVAGNTGTFADPDGDAVALSASVGTVTDNGGGTWSWSFTTLDGPDDSQLVTITGDDGDATGTVTFPLIVQNVAPTLGTPSPPDGSLYLIGSTVAVSATITDPGVDTLSCTFNFDDGLGVSAPVVPIAGTCTKSKTFTLTGVYTVEIVGRDSDGALSTPKTTMIVVYDPNGGFVTGGGSITSPPGALVGNPLASGKATFGFVSKYDKKDPVPKGNTEFDFHAGDFLFSSTTYDWLVVAGAKAQYKGYGQVNGDGTYRFLLTATDGQVSGGGGIDKIRMKVWDPATNNVVYDNRLGSSDDIDLANPQAIASGSIVVHKS